jgi:hypothetical protein
VITYERQYTPYPRLVEALHDQFLDGTAERVEVGSWQSQQGTQFDTTYELADVSISVPIPYPDDEYGEAEGTWLQLTKDIFKPNLPWAEDHFQERVSGIPWNPPPSQAWWPFAQNDNAEHKKDEIFSHTYPERYWPQWAGHYHQDHAAHGIRYDYGDLDSVVELLKDQPHTRQAYLPVWFPEDTGVVEGQRVPCTLGYHFMIRRGKLSIRYYMRSCDFRRHFRDDVYMTVRLAQWVAQQLNVATDEMIMHISSLHIFEGDLELMRYEKGKRG